MTDYTELKRLAEAATEGPWEAVDYGSFDGKKSHWFVDTLGGSNVAFDDSGDPTPNHWEDRGERDMKFIAAANPAAILALIAENEYLKRLNSSQFKAIDRIHCMYAKRLLDLTGEPQTVLIPDEEFVKYFEELKQLKAEVEALRKDAGRYRHLKSSWDDGSLLDRLECNVLPEDWDVTIDAAMSKEAGHD